MSWLKLYRETENKRWAKFRDFAFEIKHRFNLKKKYGLHDNKTFIYYVNNYLYYPNFKYYLTSRNFYLYQKKILFLKKKLLSNQLNIQIFSFKKYFPIILKNIELYNKTLFELIEKINFLFKRRYERNKYISIIVKKKKKQKIRGIVKKKKIKIKKKYLDKLAYRESKIILNFPTSSSERRRYKTLTRLITFLYFLNKKIRFFNLSISYCDKRKVTYFIIKTLKKKYYFFFKLKIDDEIYNLIKIFPRPFIIRKSYLHTFGVYNTSFFKRIHNFNIYFYLKNKIYIYLYFFQQKYKRLYFNFFSNFLYFWDYRSFFRRFDKRNKDHWFYLFNLKIFNWSTFDNYSLVNYQININTVFSLLYYPFYFKFFWNNYFFFFTYINLLNKQNNNYISFLNFLKNNYNNNYFNFLLSSFCLKLKKNNFNILYLFPIIKNIFLLKKNIKNYNYNFLYSFLKPEKNIFINKQVVHNNVELKNLNVLLNDIFDIQKKKKDINKIKNNKIFLNINGYSFKYSLKIFYYFLFYLQKLNYQIKNNKIKRYKNKKDFFDYLFQDEKILNKNYWQKNPEFDVNYTVKEKIILKKNMREQLFNKKKHFFNYYYTPSLIYDYNFRIWDYQYISKYAWLLKKNYILTLSDTFSSLDLELYSKSPFHTDPVPSIAIFLESCGLKPLNPHYKKEKKEMEERYWRVFFDLQMKYFSYIDFSTFWKNLKSFHFKKINWRLLFFFWRTYWKINPKPIIKRSPDDPKWLKFRDYFFSKRKSFDENLFLNYYSFFGKHYISDFVILTLEIQQTYARFITTNFHRRHWWLSKKKRKRFGLTRKQRQMRNNNRKIKYINVLTRAQEKAIKAGVPREEALLIKRKFDRKKYYEKKKRMYELKNLKIISNNFYWDRIRLVEKIERLFLLRDKNYMLEQELARRKLARRMIELADSEEGQLWFTTPETAKEEKEKSEKILQKPLFKEALGFFFLNVKPEVIKRVDVQYGKMKDWRKPLSVPSNYGKIKRLKTWHPYPFKMVSEEFKSKESKLKKSNSNDSNLNK